MWCIISTVLAGVLAESDGLSLLQLSKANIRDDEEDDEDAVGPSVWTGPAIVVRCEASTEAGAEYGCRSAFDSDDSTAWATAGEGKGAWITATFEGSWDITAVTILQKGGDELNKRLKLTFSDSSIQQIDLSNSMDAQTIELAPVRTSSVRIDVLDVYGTLHNGARTIAFTGKSADAVAPVSSATPPGKDLMELFGDVTTAAAVAGSLVDTDGVAMQGLSVFSGGSGYTGVYHAYVGEEYEVRLATSSDLTSTWKYVRTLVKNARSPKIFVCSENNNNILLAYEKWMTAKSRAPSRIAFQFFYDEAALTEGPPRVTYTAPLTAGFMSQLEGDPTIYSASVTRDGRKEVLSASVGFRYQDMYRNIHQLATGELELTMKGSSLKTSSFTGSRAAAYQAFFEMRGADGNSGSGTCGVLKGQRYCLQEASHQLSDVWEAPAVYLYAFADEEDGAPEGSGAAGLVSVDASNVAEWRATKDPLSGAGNPFFCVVPCPASVDSDECVFVSYFDRTAGKDAPQLAFVKPL